MPRAALAVALAGLALAGCNGGTVDRHALTNDASTLDSIACEGALLAHDVSHGKTTSYYAREQAEELGLQASNFSDALAHRPTVPGIEQRVRAKAQHAEQLASVLRQLHDAPSDRASAATVEQRLNELGGCA